MTRFYGLPCESLLEMPVPRFWAYYVKIDDLKAEEAQMALSVAHPADPAAFSKQLSKLADGWRPAKLSQSTVMALEAAGILQ